MPSAAVGGDNPQATPKRLQPELIAERKASLVRQRNNELVKHV